MIKKQLINNLCEFEGDLKNCECDRVSPSTSEGSPKLNVMMARWIMGETTPQSFMESYPDRFLISGLKRLFVTMDYIGNASDPMNVPLKVKVTDLDQTIEKGPQLYSQDNEIPSPLDLTKIPSEDQSMIIKATPTIQIEIDWDGSDGYIMIDGLRGADPTQPIIYNLRLYAEVNEIPSEYWDQIDDVAFGDNLILVPFDRNA